MRFLLGLDEAKIRDWSALSAVGLETPSQNQYSLVGASKKQRLPYDQIVDWVIAQMNKPFFNTKVTHKPKLIMDATGVGAPIRDMFIKAGVSPVGVSITTGSNCSIQDGIYHLGKARLIGTFIAVYDQGRIKVNPNIPVWPLMERELLSFRAQQNQSGHIKFEAAAGENDDLLTSLALAIWYGEEILGQKKTQITFPIPKQAITGGGLSSSFLESTTFASPKQDMVTRRLQNEAIDNDIRRSTS